MSPSKREHRAPFGNDRFGVLAERFARFFGTPKFIIGQTIIVFIWIIINGLVVAYRWDPYPFILLNLAFSTQAAYAAPLILLAQTRQADRDKVHEEQRERIADAQTKLLQENTTLTSEVHENTGQIAELVEAINRRTVHEP